ncbi:M48 family metallopeptidase [Actinoplanes sp. NPDC051494]|uniref:M48 family metallopeptidase n=1 Tax=Actinoplanes sp. NPDC051494 TaxID=3363907 RepID=UPI0037972624
MTEADADADVDVGAPALPSDLWLLLALLACTVVAGDLAFALWMTEVRNTCPAFAEYCSQPGLFTKANQFYQLLMPGILAYVTVDFARRRRCRPLTDQVYPQAVAVIERLMTELSVRRRPALLVGRRLGVGAYVTGVPRRPYLVMGADLLVLAGKGDRQRQIFEVVVRHEIAHLQGRDLATTMAVSLLRWSNLYAGAFMIFAAYLESLSGDTTPAGLGVTLLRVVLFTLLVEMIARAWLRVREHQADLRAGSADRAGLLALVEASGGRGGTPRLMSWLRRHPLRADRIGVAFSPRLLLASSPGRLLLGAISAGALLPTLQDRFLSGEGTNTDGLILLNGGLVGAALTGYVGLSLWRHIWFAGGVSWWEVPVTALILAGGIAAGSELAIYSTIATDRTGLFRSPPTFAALLLATLLICGWLSLTGGLGLRGGTGRIPMFLAVALPAGCLAGGGVVAGLWIWAVKLRVVPLVCAEADFGDPGGLCHAGDVQRRVTEAVLATTFTGPGPVLIALVAVAAPAILLIVTRAGASR